MTEKRHNTTAIAVGATLAFSLGATATVQADINPFAMTALEQGYRIADADTEGKCGAQNGSKKTSKEAQCGADKDTTKTRSDTKAKSSKPIVEAKCGEAKCGSNK